MRHKAIGRWTKKLDPQKFNFQGASFRLPFQSVHPDFRKHLRSLGTLTVTVTVPGSGVFHQSVDPLLIRPISPTRNLYQKTTGSRFLRYETTNGGKYNR